MKAAPDLPADEYYNFACFFGVSAAAITRDPSMLPTDRARLVDAHISDAMHYLGLAAKGGLFRNPAMRNGAKKLRSRHPGEPCRIPQADRHD